MSAPGEEYHEGYHAGYRAATKAAEARVNEVSALLKHINALVVALNKAESRVKVLEPVVRKLVGLGPRNEQDGLCFYCDARLNWEGAGEHKSDCLWVCACDALAGEVKS